MDLVYPDFLYWLFILNLVWGRSILKLVFANT